MKIRMMKTTHLLAVIALSLALTLSLALASLGGCATTGGGERTAQEMVSAANQKVATITVQQAKMDYDQGGYVFLDVRDPNEYKMGHVPEAMNVSRGTLEFKIASQVPDKTARIDVYCKTGGRGALASDTLARMGYTNVRNVAGGWEAWMSAGYPVE
jgi:rhodanese-related sulfurtransferase